MIITLSSICYCLSVHLSSPSSCLIYRALHVPLFCCRNVFADQQTRKEIKQAMEEQQRRLQRQLEAAQRREAGAAAAAATASLSSPRAGVPTAFPISNTTGPAPMTGPAMGAAAHERSETVRRRRAMLHAEEARAKIYAFKRKGEVRVQALLRACVQGAASEGDIKAAAEAFEAAAEGGVGGFGKGAVARRGVVNMAGGAPKAISESWNEQVRLTCLLCCFSSLCLAADKRSIVGVVDVRCRVRRSLFLKATFHMLVGDFDGSTALLRCSVVQMVPIPHQLHVRS